MQCSGTFSWRFCNQAPRRRRPQGAASVRRAHARSVASRRIQRDERFLATTRSSTDIAISSKSSSTRSSHSVASPRATRRPHATTWPSCISPVPTSDKLGARPARGGFGGMCVGAPRAVIAWAKTGFARLSPSWEGLGTLRGFPSPASGCQPEPESIMDASARPLMDVPVEATPGESPHQPSAAFSDAAFSGR